MAASAAVLTALRYSALKPAAPPQMRDEVLYLSSGATLAAGVLGVAMATDFQELARTVAQAIRRRLRKAHAD
ncbi:hypothetical protein EON66_02465 [archaeon]|nr:MAG: hypothetical protein EON66_02465 [archaeon]